MKTRDYRIRFTALTTAMLAGILMISPLHATEVKIGIETGWLEKFYFYDSLETGKFTHEHYDNIEGALFIDLEYFRGSIGYSKHVLRYVFDNGNQEMLYSDYNISFINFMALAKYPFKFYDDKLQLWPAIGLEYDHNIKYEKNGEDLTKRYNELDDLYLQAGAGMDVNILPRVALTGTFLTGLNLTPRVGSGSGIGSDFAGLNCRFLFGVSYTF